MATMTTFLTISSGATAATARPVFATADQSVIDAALAALVDRIAPDTNAQVDGSGGDE